VLQYDKAIHNINRVLKQGLANDIYDQEALEFAIDVLRRENKVLEKLDNGYACGNCGQISSAKDIDSTTKEYFEDRNINVVSIEGTGISFTEYICPKCNRRVMGKDFKKLK
jgi:DNA-directed RNA polymerase subunit RPC12/RpoP